MTNLAELKDDSFLDDAHAMDEGTKKTSGGHQFFDNEVGFHGQAFDDDEIDFQFKKPALFPSDMRVMFKYIIYVSIIIIIMYAHIYTRNYGFMDRETDNQPDRKTHIYLQGWIGFSEGGG